MDVYPDLFRYEKVKTEVYFYFSSKDDDNHDKEIQGGTRNL